MTGDAVVRQVGRPKLSWWQVLRTVLVLGWVFWAALSWWVTPREATVDDALADLTNGRAVSYEWGSGWSADAGLFWPDGEQLQHSAGTEGPYFLWHTTDGRQRYTTVDGGVPDPQSQQVTGPDGRAMAGALRVFDTIVHPDGGFPVSTVLAGLGIAGVVLSLWALISGAEPVTGTRWFWFWLIGGVPMGLGLLWWLARERPWSYRVPPRTGPDGEPRRLKWWAGIGIGLLSAVLLGLVVMGLHNLLGDTLVPSTP